MDVYLISTLVNNVFIIIIINIINEHRFVTCNNSKSVKVRGSVRSQLTPFKCELDSNILINILRWIDKTMTSVR